MDKLGVKLENCYGIKKLEYQFDFSKFSTYVMYSPNGVMKTSFAKTFRDIATGERPCDMMDDSQASVCNLSIDDSASQIEPKDVCVIESYNEKVFDSEEKVLTLLANEETRKEYLDIYKELDSVKQALITKLKKISRSTNCEEEIMKTFSENNKSIFEILVDVLDDVNESQESFSFKYNTIFDPEGKIKKFLSENRELFDEYCKKYDELISNSDFFAKGKDSIFGTTEAKNLIDSISGNEFFIAGHKVNLKKRGEVNNSDDFAKVLNDEIEKIFNNDKLREIFNKVDAKLQANKTLQSFKKVIEKDHSLIIRLNNYEQFRKETWFSYLKKISIELESLVELYKDKKPNLEEIIKKASKQESKWEQAIKEFHNRFTNVPFALVIENKSDAILNMQTPTISFKFSGNPTDRRKLLDVLSQGEKRAFYLLNVIFEIRAREKDIQNTLFVMDDIADSFDYKNKYAIVEYLNDLTKIDHFYSIILTHNFDFYRTIGGRLGVPRENRLHAIKTTNEIRIVQEVYQNHPFITWRMNMKSSKTCTATKAKKHIIALIPLVRNLIEYCGNTDNLSNGVGKDYDVLTSLLHSRPDTKNITFGDLKHIYKTCLNNDDFDSLITDKDVVYDVIIDLANNIGVEEFNLENKIILSMAIRHTAEEHMLSKITLPGPIGGNQTRKLYQEYINKFSNDNTHKDVIKTLESVNIMTPENIHLNSFMYEPILDMGIDELKNLYSRVLGL